MTASLDLADAAKVAAADVRLDKATQQLLSDLANSIWGTAPQYPRYVVEGGGLKCRYRFQLEADARSFASKIAVEVKDERTAK